MVSRERGSGSLEGLNPYFRGPRVEGDALSAIPGTLQSSRFALRVNRRLRAGIRVRVIDGYTLLGHLHRVTGAPVVPTSK